MVEESHQSRDRLACGDSYKQRDDKPLPYDVERLPSALQSGDCMPGYLHHRAPTTSAEAARNLGADGLASGQLSERMIERGGLKGDPRTSLTRAPGKVRPRLGACRGQLRALGPHGTTSTGEFRWTGPLRLISTPSADTTAT
jgi:hypothetical protein